MNEHCQFESAGPNVVACSQCGRRMATTRRPEQVHARCRGAKPPAPRQLCAHLGEVRRKELCQSCGGHVEIKVFACSHFGALCTVGKQLPGVPHVCAKCPAHTPKEPEPIQIDIPKSTIRTSCAPLRVGLLSPTLATGGAERWWLSLCRQFAGDGELAISGVALTDGAPSDPAIVLEAKRYAPVWGSQTLSVARRDAGNVERLETGFHAAAKLRQASDLIIAWGNADAATLLRGFPGRAVLLSHGSGEWTRTIFEACVPELFAAFPGRLSLVSVSGAARRSFPEPVRPQVRVIGNGIDLDRCAPSRSRAEIRGEWGVGPEQLAIGYVGRFSAEKNPLAAARAASRIPEAVCVYAGVGFDRSAYRQEIGAAAEGGAEGGAGASDQATINRGWHSAVAAGCNTAKCRFVVPPHVGDVYAGLDVLMAASHEEGCSLTILEALAAGVPVVATPVGALPELEERFGPLATPIEVQHAADPAMLAAAVRMAHSAGQHPPILGRPLAVRVNGDPAAAQRIAWQHFSAARMARDWKSFLLAGS